MFNHEYMFVLEHSAGSQWRDSCCQEAEWKWRYKYDTFRNEPQR